MDYEHPEFKDYFLTIDAANEKITGANISLIVLKQKKFLDKIEDLAKIKVLGLGEGNLERGERVKEKQQDIDHEKEVIKEQFMPIIEKEGLKL